MAKRDRGGISSDGKEQDIHPDKDYPLELLRSNWPYLAKYELDILKRFCCGSRRRLSPRGSVRCVTYRNDQKRKEVRALRRIDNEALLRWIV
jgi:hypothetical protein